MPWRHWISAESFEKACVFRTFYFGIMGLGRGFRFSPVCDCTGHSGHSRTVPGSGISVFFLCPGNSVLFLDQAFGEYGFEKKPD